MLGAENISPTWGIAFLMGAEAVAAFVAKAVSSPQTAELNAHKRAPTLMKWVNVGTVEAIALVVIASSIDKRNRSAILWGAGLELAITYGEYLHAKQSGLDSTEPGTEDWS